MLTAEVRLPSLQQLARKSIRDHIRSLQKKTNRKRNEDSSSSDSEQPNKRARVTECGETSGNNNTVDPPHLLRNVSVLRNNVTDNRRQQEQPRVDRVVIPPPALDSDNSNHSFLSSDDSSLTSDVDLPETPNAFQSLMQQFREEKERKAAGLESTDEEEGWDGIKGVHDVVFEDDPDDDLFNETSENDEDDEFCEDCQTDKDKNNPQKVKPYNPDEIYPYNSLNSKVEILPIPKHLKLYLKYKHELVFPLGSNKV